MAGKWQIRHKLMIGLGLVVGIMGLLLGGTLKGLASYRTTMNSMDSKMAELKSAQEVKKRTDQLAVVTKKPDPGSAELIELAEFDIGLLDESKLLWVTVLKRDAELIKRAAAQLGIEHPPIKLILEGSPHPMLMCRLWV